jgi:hypothetical protein
MRPIRAPWAILGALASVFILLTLPAKPTLALPSYARQTGAACNQCHIGSFGPQLTEYGRQFKLNGFVWGDKISPISAMALGSFSHTAKDQSPAPDRFHQNDNAALDQLSLFYGGRIYDNVGAFVQGTYDGVGETLGLDNADIRYADQGSLWGEDLVYGLSLNNNPTVEDIWNSTPAWGYPFAGSPLAPTPAAAALIDGGLAQQVVGASTYALWNELLYVDLGGYAELPEETQSGLGVDPTGEQQIDGVAPYWRLALQQQLGDHYFSLGTYGLFANIDPGRVSSAGSDQYTDVAFDTSYQFIPSSDHIITADATYIHEFQNLDASKRLGNATHGSDQLNVFRINTSYTYADTVTGRVGFFDTWGSKDMGVYGGDSVTGSPDSDGFVFELDYTPFGKEDSWSQPYFNIRFGLQYVLYDKFNGSQSNYDGAGTNASDNNTLYFFTWFVF